MSDWFAHDGFHGDDGILGGTLADTGTPFAARDKVQHLVAGLLLGRILVRWAGFGPWAVIGSVAAAAAAWELLELVRYRAWRRRGLGPWPVAADLVSWRDIVTTIAGAWLALLLL